jgi:multimeric flavodoxin WrbA
MKTLVLYYSYTGNAKKFAEAFAEKDNADIAEIESVKRPGKLKAYTLGCFATLGGKSWPIQPLNKDMAAYDRLVLFIPVWAGNPPPFVNAVLEELPTGKTISVNMVSASGKSNCKEKLEAKIKAKGSKMESFEDIKS